MSYTSLETYWSNAGTSVPSDSTFKTDFFPDASDYSVETYIVADTEWSSWY